MSPVYFFKPRIVVGRSGNFLAFCLYFFLRVVKFRLFLCFSWKSMFPFEKIKSFLVSNEDLKLVSLFGRKDCGLFGGKIQKRNEISLRRKKIQTKRQEIARSSHNDSWLKKYTGDIRPL